MYLSRLLLDPLDRQVRKELANRYELHRTLCACFEGFPREQIGLLYRVEQADPYQVKPISTLVQTLTDPDWEKLTREGRLLEAAQVKAYEPRIQKGSRLIFRLLANPTVRRQEGAFAGKRVELAREEEEQAWLARKGERHGFEPLRMDIIPMGKFVSSKVLDGKKTDLTHLAVLFEGLLRVTDADAFNGALRTGIGSAKAFGFGLLSVAKE